MNRSLPHPPGVFMALFSLMVLVPPTPARAQLTALPQATFYEQNQIFGNRPPSDPYLPETFSYSGSQNFAGTTTTLSTFAQTQSVGGTSLSKVALTVRGEKFVSGTSTDPFVGPTFANIDYYFRISAAPGTSSIPLIMPLTWSLEANRTGSGHARARYQATVFSINGAQVYGRERELVVRPSNAQFSMSDAGSANDVFVVNNNAITGDIYHVSLVVQGHMERETNAVDSTMSFSASLDPIPYVDPIFAAANPGVQLEFSDNLFPTVSAAPEPGSLAFTLLPIVFALSRVARFGGRKGRRV